MHHFWKIIVKPLLDILQPRAIVEVGADYGHNTRNILDYCRQSDCRAHIIDPLPKFDPGALKSEYGDVFDFYKALSLNALPVIPSMDVVLIDGDHNWYTVFHELKLIEKNCALHQSPFPVALIHDIAWPYARRDLYYHPDNIPEAFRKPYAQKGLLPGEIGMADAGGLNPHLNNAIYAHNFQNGVLTAVEDFMEESPASLHLLQISGFFGLGILYASHHMEGFPALSDFFSSLSATDRIGALLKMVETERIENFIHYEETRNQFKSFENAKRREAEDHARRVERLEKRIAAADERVNGLEAQAKADAAAFEEKFQVMSGRLEVMAGRLEESEKQRHAAGLELQKHRQTIKNLEQAANKLRSERDQLVLWIKNFRYRYKALLDTNRWKLGNALISFLTFSRFKKNFTLVTHHIERQFEDFDKFRVSGNVPAPRSLPAQKQPLKRQNLTVAIIAWDTGHNPLGRAYLLAEALSRFFHVMLLGPSFPRYDHGVWAPLQNADIEVLRLPGSNFPEFLEMLETSARRIPADIIIACKARLPSLQLGLMMKAFKNRPLFVDVDDYELSFFENKTPLTLADIEDQRPKDLEIPFEQSWTRFAEHLLQYADGIFVSNSALQKKFGGAIIPHGRDEARFDPSLYSREARRAELGIGDGDKVVLFLGTPREHKGVAEVLSAVIACRKAAYKLVVIGTPPDKSYEKKLRRIGGDALVLVPDQPFKKLPENLMIADLVCLIQNTDSSISKYQLPAKAIDALAMGIPVLATRTEPLDPLIQAGAVMPVEIPDLTRRIDEILSDSETYRARQQARRELFLKHYSYQAIAETMYQEILGALPRPRHLDAGALDFLRVQKNMASTLTPQKPFSASQSGGWDVVVFWKQNDTGIYGRRSDMLIKYLARRPEIRKIAVFDAPISIEALREKAENGGTVQDRLIYRETLLRDWGVRNTDKISFHTFIYGAGRAATGRIWRYPDRNAYFNFIENALKSGGIDPKQAIFWFYPQNEAIPKIAKHFHPKLNIVDLVDDHRTWPNLSEIKKLYLTNHYREVLHIADLAFANCRKVRESLLKFAPDILLVPNGCDLDSPPEIPQSLLFQKFQAIKGPKLGYVGNLEQDKIDVELVKCLADRHPEWNIILIGSTHANAGILELDALPNVHFFGVVPYPEVRAWIQRFDVAILPHVDSEKTQSMNPLKLYVYCALGVPVVSTDIENLDELKSFVSVAASHDDFVAKTEAVLSGKHRMPAADLESCLRQNSWEKRVDQVIQAITEKWSGKNSINS